MAIKITMDVNLPSRIDLPEESLRVMREMQVRAAVQCARFGHDWYSPIANMYNGQLRIEPMRCRRCGMRYGG